MALNVIIKAIRLTYEIKSAADVQIMRKLYMPLGTAPFQSC